MRARLRAQRNLILLIKQRWARADDRHFALDHINQLRQFIEAGFAQEITNRRQERLGIGPQMGCQLPGTGPHNSEFIHIELGIVRSNSIQYVANRSLRGQPQHDREDYKITMKPQ